MDGSLEHVKAKKVTGKIILVDDQIYEKDLLKIALLKRNWSIEIEYFSGAEAALEYLKNSRDEIFLIICDMNMPKINGLDFKRSIDTNDVLRIKSIPFIFASTGASKEQVTEAYDYRVQGYFKKPATTEEQAEMLDIIIRYWIISRHPNRDNI